MVLPFKSKSDTEVLLNSYVYWGDKCFNYFDGMWAVCIFDKEKNKLILSRDYLGQKPLYYFYSNGKFCFSSKSDSIFLSNGFILYTTKPKFVANETQSFV